VTTRREMELIASGLLARCSRPDPAESPYLVHWGRRGHVRERRDGVYDGGGSQQANEFPCCSPREVARKQSVAPRTLSGGRRALRRPYHFNRKSV
jgi:hypothetical protein